MEDRRLDESELVERATRGDLSAYEELVHRYEELVFRVAYAILGDPDEARDASQEGFVRAWHALPRFRSGAPIRPWLLRIVGNAARNRRRAELRAHGLADRIAQLAGPTTSPSAEDEAVEAETRADLLRALAALRDDDRTLIALRWLLGLSEAELAEVLGVRRGTVKSRLSRAMQRLRGRLGGEDQGEVQR